jgi:hypothetical protein
MRMLATAIRIASEETNWNKDAAEVPRDVMWFAFSPVQRKFEQKEHIDTMKTGDMGSAKARWAKLSYALTSLPEMPACAWVFDLSDESQNLTYTSRRPSGLCFLSLIAFALVCFPCFFCLLCRVDVRAPRRTDRVEAQLPWRLHSGQDGDRGSERVPTG